MFLNVLGIFFTSALICSAAPTLEKEHCGKPGQIEGATLQGVWNAETYSPGSVATFTCLHGYIRDGPIKMACIEGSWLDISRGQCKSIRQTCNAPPVVQYGDITDLKKLSYPSGSSVKYKCANYYKMEGKETITCRDGEWEKEPICRAPCTVREIDMQQNNIQFKFGESRKLYSEHFDYMTFVCIPGYKISDEIRLRIQCLDGVLKFPKCLKEGQSCGTPPVVQHGDITDLQRLSYPSGSSVKYKCANYYKMEGKETITCRDGEWEKEPICRAPCTVTEIDMQQNNIQFKFGESRKLYSEHFDYMTFVCMPGYKISDEIRLRIQCLDGVLKFPKCLKEGQSCDTPPVVQHGDITDIKKLSYPSGSSVKYKCANYYKIEGKETITCRDGEWEKEPICRGYKISDEKRLRIQCLDGVLKFPKCLKEGQSCGTPPVVQNGDITDIKRLSYPSGSSVKYKCANYYKIEGKETITCRDGEWEKEPICRVPCTVRKIDMQQNNIQFKFSEIRKLYSEHFDNMTFVCIPGYTISDEKRLRIQCLDGVLKFPKCLQEGFCVLQQTEMSHNNIHYNKIDEIENGQTIEFECAEGTVSENSLKGTCINKQIKYPKCSNEQPCLPPKIPNALVSPKNEDSYQSGSSIDIKCEDTYVLNGHISVKCDNGQWDELPQCFKPCTISTRSLDKNHIEMKPSENPPEILEHGTEVNVKCKANFRRPGSLTALCYDGIVKYPRCFSGRICRINQQNLDDNFLDLDERQENEVFYGEGETVIFKCKAGYSNRTGLTGTCTKSKWAAEYEITYPVCTQDSSV